MDGYSPKPHPSVAIGLNAVLAAVDDDQPKVLCISDQQSGLSLPYGRFDPTRHRTFEVGLREWVEKQTRIKLGYVEQLYTFGDLGREAPAAALHDGDQGDRIISVGYLAVTPQLARIEDENTQWREWYDFFPWEDWRQGEPIILSAHILPALHHFVEQIDDPTARAAQRARLAAAFGANGWEEERALERYELMYEAGIVIEALRDRDDLSVDNNRRALAKRLGIPMASDHRRILATAIGRLRGKLKYRPIIFRLTPPKFTLFALQKTVEAIVGFPLHKQNFRRSVEAIGMVTRTDQRISQPSGRPAALFTTNERLTREFATAGLTIPRIRNAPRFFCEKASQK